MPLPGTTSFVQPEAQAHDASLVCHQGQGAAAGLRPRPGRSWRRSVSSRSSCRRWSGSCCRRSTRVIMTCAFIIFSILQPPHLQCRIARSHQSSNKSNKAGRILAGANGVTDVETDDTPLPKLLVATAEQAYSIPAVRPYTVIGEPVPLAERVVCPAARQVTV